MEQPLRMSSAQGLNLWPQIQLLSLSSSKPTNVALIFSRLLCSPFRLPATTQEGPIWTRYVPRLKLSASICSSSASPIPTQARKSKNMFAMLRQRPQLQLQPNLRRLPRAGINTPFHDACLLLVMPTQNMPDHQAVQL